jgi:hypothetical protein
MPKRLHHPCGGGRWGFPLPEGRFLPPLNHVLSLLIVQICFLTSLRLIIQHRAEGSGVVCELGVGSGQSGRYQSGVACVLTDLQVREREPCVARGAPTLNY